VPNVGRGCGDITIINMAKIAKIYVDRDLCIGAAACIAVAPGVYALDDENKAIILDAHGADDETIVLSAKSCPVKAIQLIDENGEQVYP